MHHKDFLLAAKTILNHRSKEYGDPRPSFDRAAVFASTLLGRNVTPFDVTTIMLAVKLSRLSYDQAHTDSWVDAINYIAFCGEFSGAPVPGPVTEVMLAKVESDIAEELRKNAA